MADVVARTSALLAAIPASHMRVSLQDAASSLAESLPTGTMDGLGVEDLMESLALERSLADVAHQRMALDEARVHVAREAGAVAVLRSRRHSDVLEHSADATLGRTRGDATHHRERRSSATSHRHLLPERPPSGGRRTRSYSRDTAGGQVTSDSGARDGASTRATSPPQAARGRVLRLPGEDMGYSDATSHMAGAGASVMAFPRLRGGDSGSSAASGFESLLDARIPEYPLESGAGRSTQDAAPSATRASAGSGSSAAAASNVPWPLCNYQRLNQSYRAATTQAHSSEADAEKARLQELRRAFDYSTSVESSGSDTDVDMLASSRARRVAAMEEQKAEDDARHAAAEAKRAAAEARRAEAARIEAKAVEEALRAVRKAEEAEFREAKKLAANPPPSMQDAGAECALCLAPFTDPISVPCDGKHVFCRGCIKSALRFKPSCPMCRHDLSGFNPARVATSAAVANLTTRAAARQVEYDRATLQLARGQSIMATASGGSWSVKRTAPVAPAPTPAPAAPPAAAARGSRAVILRPRRAHTSEFTVNVEVGNTHEDVVIRGKNLHKWTMRLCGEGGMKVEPFIESVEFRMLGTLGMPPVVKWTAPYEFTRSGWATSNRVQITVAFKRGSLATGQSRTVQWEHSLSFDGKGSFSTHKVALQEHMYDRVRYTASIGGSTRMSHTEAQTTTGTATTASPFDVASTGWDRIRNLIGNDTTSTTETASRPISSWRRRRSEALQYGTSVSRGATVVS